MNQKEIQRLYRFLIVGASGTLLDFGVLVLLKTLGYSILIAATTAFCVGILNNFTWNYRWTYADARHKQVWVQFGQFVLVSAIGLLLNNTIVLLLETPLGALMGQPSTGYLPAKVIATAVVVGWNFIANRYWTFSDVAQSSGTTAHLIQVRTDDNKSLFPIMLKTRIV